MKPASALEGFLRRREYCRQPKQDLRIDCKIVINRGKLLPNRLNGRLAANAATRRGENMAGQLLEIHRFRMFELHVDHIAGRPAKCRLRWRSFFTGASVN